MTNSVRTLLSLFSIIVACQGFAPVSKCNIPSSTALQFGFLKELGLEKPSWLPDFGSKKEDPATDVDTTDEEATEVDEASVEE